MNIFTLSPDFAGLETLWQSFTTYEVLSVDDISDTMQMRVTGTNEDVVADYAVQIDAGKVFPPLDVFEIELESGETEFVLADGYHRFYAQKDCGIEAVKVRLFKGRSWAEAELYATAHNRRNGLGLTAADNARAIGKVLSTPGAIHKFAPNNKLDTKVLAAYMGITQRSVDRLTTDFRESMDAIRDLKIRIASDEGMSIRETAKSVGVSVGKVHNTVSSVQNKTLSENEHPPINPKKPSSVLALLRDSDADSEDDMYDLEFDEDAIAESLDSGDAERREAALETVQAAAFATIARNMAKSGPKAKEKATPDYTKRCANALGGLVAALDVLSSVNPDLTDIAKYINGNDLAKTDLVVLKGHLEVLSNSLDMENVS